MAVNVGTPAKAASAPATSSTTTSMPQHQMPDGGMMTEPMEGMMDGSD